MRESSQQLQFPSGQLIHADGQKVQQMLRDGQLAGAFMDSPEFAGASGLGLRTASH